MSLSQRTDADSRGESPRGTTQPNLKTQSVFGNITNMDEIYSVEADQDVCNSFSYRYEDWTQLPVVRNVFIAVYIVVMVLSIVGNIMVMWTVWRNKHMRTVTNYYIVNLAVCDFLVALFVMPLKLLEYTAPCTWHVFSQDAVCSFLYFVLPVFVFASVLTLVAISIERYYAIVHPLDAMKIHSKSRTKKILAATWIIPMIVASPYLFCKSYPFLINSGYGSISRQICTDRFDDIDRAIYGEDVESSGRFRTGFFLFLFVAIYLVPLIVIVTTCVKIARCLWKPIVVERPDSIQSHQLMRRREENKRRVARMIIVVAIAFIIDWSPFYIVSFVSQVQARSFLRDSNFLFTMLATHLVGFLNSCINPFIYNSMSDKFRKGFRQFIFTICCCVPRPLARKESPPSHSKFSGDLSAEIDSQSTPLRSYTSCSPSLWKRFSTKNKQRQDKSPRGGTPIEGTPEFTRRTGYVRAKVLKESIIHYPTGGEHVNIINDKVVPSTKKVTTLESIWKEDIGYYSHVTNQKSLRNSIGEQPGNLLDNPNKSLLRRHNQFVYNAKKKDKQKLKVFNNGTIPCKDINIQMDMKTSQNKTSETQPSSETIINKGEQSDFPLKQINKQINHEKKQADNTLRLCQQNATLKGHTKLGCNKTNHHLNNSSKQTFHIPKVSSMFSFHDSSYKPEHSLCTELQKNKKAFSCTKLPDMCR